MHKRILKLAIIFVLIFSWIFGYPPIYENFWRAGIWQNPQIPPEIQEAQAATRTIEQQINIIDQEYSNASTDYLPDNNDLGSLGIIKFDPDKYNAETLYFEAVLKAGSDNWVRVRSDSFSVPASAQQYTVKLKVDTDVSCESSGAVAFAQLYSITSSSEVISILGGCGVPGATVYIQAARLIIVQSDGTSITATETQIEVGNNENTTNESYADLDDKKIYDYDSTKFDPAPTIFFEATIKNDNVAGGGTNTGDTDCNSTWAVDDSGTGSLIWLNPSNACGSPEDSAEITLDAANTSHYLLVDHLGFSLPAGATLTNAQDGIKVDIVRSSTKIKGSDAVDNIVSIVKGGSVGSTNKLVAGAWADVTYGASGDKWGETWIDTDIESDTFGFVISAKSSNDKNAPIGHINTIKITIYYTTAGGVATTSVRLWNKTNGSAVTGSEVTTTSTSWLRIRSSEISSANFPTDKEYVVQIMTSDTNGPARIANAKIILTQSDAGGIGKFETMQQYVNTKKSLLGIGETVYARLAIAGGATVSGSTVSTTSTVAYDCQRTASSISPSTNIYDTEISTDNSSYTQQDFDNKYDSTKWVGGTFAYYFEATLKRTLVPMEQVDISNSWLIIQVSGLATSLATTIQIRNVADSDNVSSITFPAGDISSPVSNPSGLDTQVLTETGSAAAPVAILKSSTAYTLWYNVTDTSGWADTVDGEKLYTIALGDDLTLATFNGSAYPMTVWGTDQTATPQALEAGVSKDLYLQITLSSNYGKTGESTLSVLGEL